MNFSGHKTPEKSKSAKALRTLADFGELQFGGGGGNRTPVREHSTQSFYRFRLGLNLISDVAPNQAVCDQPIVSSCATSRQAQTFASLIVCRLPGLSDIIRFDVTAEAIRSPAD